MYTQTRKKNPKAHQHYFLAQGFSFKAIHLVKVLQVFLLISGKTDSELQILEN